MNPGLQFQGVEPFGKSIDLSPFVLKYVDSLLLPGQLPVSD